jgi:hypothetical protein
VKRIALLLLLALTVSVTPAHATITLFGSASNPTPDSATASNTTTGIAITPPASMTAGMLVVVIAQARFAGVAWTEMNVTTTGGQKWHELNDSGCTTTAQSCRMWATVFNGTWAANPVFETTAATSNTAVMLVFQESDGTKHFDIDVMPVFATFAAGTTPFTKTISAITTQTAGAVAIAVWMSSDDNTWGIADGGMDVANPSRAARCATLAAPINRCHGRLSGVRVGRVDRQSVSQTETALGGDAGMTLIMAFKTIAAPSTTAPTVDVFIDMEASTNGTTMTTAILGSATHGSGGSWTTNSGVPGAANTVSTGAQMSLSSTRA